MCQVPFSNVLCVAHVLCFCFSFHSRHSSFIALVSNKSSPSWFLDGVDDTKDDVEDLKREERTEMSSRCLEPVQSWSLNIWPNIYLKGSLQHSLMQKCRSCRDPIQYLVFIQAQENVRMEAFSVAGLQEVNACSHCCKSV